MTRSTKISAAESLGIYFGVASCMFYIQTRWSPQDRDIPTFENTRKMQASGTAAAEKKKHLKKLFSWPEHVTSGKEHVTSGAKAILSIEFLV